MALAKTSAKGQVVIPAPLREKYGIKPGSLVDIREIDGRLVIVPVSDDPISAAHGMLKGAPKLTEALLRERAEEKEREDGGWRGVRSG